MATAFRYNFEIFEPNTEIKILKSFCTNTIEYNEILVKKITENK